MPDEITPESSPASTESQAPQSSADILFAEPEKTAPAEKQPEESAPSETQTEPEKSGETEPASEADKEGSEEGEKPKETEGQPKETKAERRIKQLDAKLKEVERQLAEARNPKPPDPTEPKRPKLDECETIEEYEQKMDKYELESREYERKRAIEADRKEREAEAKKAETEKQQKAAEEAWAKKEAQTVKRNPDFNTAKALEAVQPNAPMIAFLDRSDIGPDVLHYLDANPDEADSIRDMHPIDAVLELGRIASTLSDQIKGIKPKAPASKPPRTVAGSAASVATGKNAADLLYG